MQTKPKSNSVVTHAVSPDYEQILFSVLGAGVVALDMTMLSRGVKDRAAIHGMIQRISDGAAISRNPETGKPATPAEKLARMARLVEHYHTGTDEWSMVRTGEGALGGYLYRALCILYPDQKPESIREWLGKKSKEEQAAMRKTEKVAAIIADIKSKEPVDEDSVANAEEMLAELGEV